MTILIILAAIIVYLLTLSIIIYTIAKDEDFDTVGELCGWVYENHPLVFIPVVNTFCLIIAAVLCPFFCMAKKISKVKLPKRKKSIESMNQITEITKSLIDTFYWSPVCIGTTFTPYKQRWTNSFIEQDLLKEGWVFKSEEECKPLCEELNRIIKNIK